LAAPERRAETLGAAALAAMPFVLAGVRRAEG
jgi:hypothetical protein